RRHASAIAARVTTKKQSRKENCSQRMISSRNIAAKLLRAEQLALDNLVNQRAKTVVLLPDLADDRVDLLPVARLGRAAGGVGHQLRRQRTGDLVLVGQQQLLEFVDILKRPAVGQHVGR